MLGERAAENGDEEPPVDVDRHAAYFRYLLLRGATVLAMFACNKTLHVDENQIL